MRFIKETIVKRCVEKYSHSLEYNLLSHGRMAFLHAQQNLCDHCEEPLFSNATQQDKNQRCCRLPIDTRCLVFIAAYAL